MILRVVLRASLLVAACAPAPGTQSEETLTCGDAPGDTPMQECIERNLASRDATVRLAIDTLTAAGLARADLEHADATWRRVTLERCGPRPDSVAPPPDSARAVWACYSGAFSEHLAILRDLHPLR